MMDAKTAIDKIKEYNCENCDATVMHTCGNTSCLPGSKHCEYGFAMDAMNKQIPMALRKKRLEDKNTGKCPVCGAQMQFFDTRESCYCYNCGQAIELW